MAVQAENGKALMVVEDDDGQRGALGILLAGAGYRVFSAANGREALDLLRNGPVPDLILLDMLMPVLDGWHLLRQLKAMPFLGTVPIIIITGTILAPEWGLAHSCAGILHKPIEPEPLLREIQRCLA